jgi:hypothetical protein
MHARAPTRIVLVSARRRDDLPDLSVDSPAVGSLPRARSAPPIADLLRSGA